MSDTATTNESIVIERIFEAPIDLIWQLWTQPEHFKKWYGPEGFTVPVAEIDLQVGGKRFIGMQSPDGSMKFWTAGEFMEIIPKTRLVYTESIADEDGNAITEPSSNGIPPMTTEVTVLLEDLNDRTRMVMTHAGLPEGSGGANEGWKQSFNKLANYVKTILENK